MVKKGMPYPLMIHSPKAMMSLIRAIVFPSTEAKKYIKYLQEIALVNKLRFGSQQKIRMDVLVCPRDRREIDAHNFTKVLLDAMEQAGVFVNDSQVEHLTARLGPVVKEGKLVVNMWEFTTDKNELLKAALEGYGGGQA